MKHLCNFNCHSCGESCDSANNVGLDSTLHYTSPSYTSPHSAELHCTTVEPPNPALYRLIWTKVGSASKTGSQGSSLLNFCCRRTEQPAGDLSLNSPACITLHYSASPDSVSSVCSANREGNFMSNIPKTVDGVVLDSRWANPYLARLAFLSHFIP